VVRRARDAGVTRIATVGIDPESGERAVSIAHRHTGVYAVVGLHPHDAGRLSDTLLARLEALSRCDKVVAIGETGLDFHRDRAPRETQRAAFREQIRLARRRGLPVVVHDRYAHDNVLSILSEENAPRWAASSTASPGPRNGAHGARDEFSRFHPRCHHLQGVGGAG